MRMVHEKPRPPEGKNAASGQQRCAKSEPTQCRCASQLHFAGFPPPPKPGEGKLSDYLDSRSGWHEAIRAANEIRITDREGRAQAEHSGGRIIFGSGRGQGWKHIHHAEAWEVRQCCAELRNRAASHLRRAAEIETAWREMGGAL